MSLYNIICLFASGSEICLISSCIVTFQAMEGGKQGQRVFKIGASGEAKLLFKSPTGSNHSVNNLIKKREKGLFACVRVRTQANYLTHRLFPGNGDQPTDQQGEYRANCLFRKLENRKKAEICNFQVSKPKTICPSPPGPLSLIHI